jgi:shikimate dehydrogenase
MMYPSVTTKLVFLLGKPLGHSLSPRMHNRIFNKKNMDYLYIPVEVSEEDLPFVFNGLKRMNFAGCNVTIPHKIKIMDLVDELDNLASAIGAVNTVCVEKGQTKGYNTDGEGFLMALKPHLNTPINEKKFFLIGSGGAGRAIAMTLAFHGAKRIFLCNRTISKAHILADEISKKIRDCVEVVPKNNEHIGRVISDAHVLINSTSIGMQPNDEGIPIDPSLLHDELIVTDIVYKPRMTNLLKAAKERACTIIDGLGMLVYQGAESFKLWTNEYPPVEEMFDEVNSV